MKEVLLPCGTTILTDGITFTDKTGQVSARVIAHTKSAVTGIEMKTFEWEFPRIILAEVNTHKALNKNASSSRAIPVSTILDQVRNNPSMPVRFGKKNSGMQDAGVHDGYVELFNGDLEDTEGYSAESAWRMAASSAAYYSEQFDKAGFAKQVCNRLTEPFQRMKQVISGTDFENFWWLRDHDMADPTIDALAKCAKAALEASTPVVLQPGEWHVPYYNDGVWIPFKESIGGLVVDKFGHSLEHALVISASCCAQVSYRKLDDTIEKAKGVVARLNLHGEEPNDPVHASPLEHQGTPIDYTDKWDCTDDGVNVLHLPFTWEEGITHMRRDGTLCSGNLRGYRQHRQLVPNHVREG